MKITPLKDNILIKIEDGITTTDSGIYINSTKVRREGVVVSIGEEVTDLKPKDKVGYQSQTYPNFKKDNDTYLVIPESQILYKYG